MKSMLLSTLGMPWRSALSYFSCTAIGVINRAFHLELMSRLSNPMMIMEPRNSIRLYGSGPATGKS